MPTYDGTQKANSGCAQNIPYHIFRTSYVDNLRQDALAMASSEAIAFCALTISVGRRLSVTQAR